MAFDFEALVGHLYVVGGRSLATQPPGMLVEVAPKKAARGRELDTIFILVTPSGDVTAPAAFYDQMANLAAERYFNSTGSVTAGLRSVFNSLNQDLVDHNGEGKRHYEANLVCGVLKDNELFLARVGAGIALYRHMGEMNPFPTDFTSDEALYRPPLGVQPVPDIRMTRYGVMQGSRLVLSDSRLADLDMGRMTAALCTNEIADVLVGYKELVSTQMTMMAIEFVPPETPSPASVKDERSSSRAPSASTTQSASATSSAAEGQSTPETSEPASRRVDGVFVAQLKAIAAGIVLFFARILASINRILDRIFPPPPEGKRGWFRTSTAIAISILIPVAIVVLVAGLGLASTGITEFETCVGDASKTANVARSINSTDRAGTLAAWNAVVSKVGECDKLHPNDPTMISLIREAQSVKDALFQIERRHVVALKSFQNANLTRAVLQGQDLYVLDSQNQLVQRIALKTNDDGTVEAASSEPMTAMRRGAVIGQYRVSDLIDIVWSDDTTQITALDKDGLLIQCSPRFRQDCEVQKLLRSESWVSPLKMELWEGRLYLLDPGANQIWRYDSTGGSFASSPIEYFAGDVRPQIQNAVGFGIYSSGTTGGSIFILTADGQTTKWLGGKQTPFVYAGFPDGQQLAGADSFYLNPDPIGQGLFITQRSSRTIFETSLSGTWFGSYQVYEEDKFASLNGVVADANLQIVYVLSGNSVFVLDTKRPAQ
ncbi:MAG: hypothetical protein GC179_04610 [Anaerolineaceae bacterium]|nr:hypothetical protein [Anaerolineaceae bacterium]